MASIALNRLPTHDTGGQQRCKFAHQGTSRGLPRLTGPNPLSLSSMVPPEALGKVSSIASGDLEHVRAETNSLPGWTWQSRNQPALSALPLHMDTKDGSHAVSPWWRTSAE